MAPGYRYPNTMVSALTQTVTTRDGLEGLPFDTSKIPAQRQFMESQTLELLYDGAFGAGKSRVGCEKGYFLSTKYPGNRGLIVRKKFTDLRDTTKVTWDRYVCPPEHVQSYNKQEHLLTLINGSEVMFHGLDQPTKVGSLEVGWIFVDEVIEFTEDDWMMLLGRLRHPSVPFHQIFAATNPADPNHWVYRRFYHDEDLQAKGYTSTFSSNTLLNPFTPKTYRDSLDQFKGRYHDRYVKGLWISFEGVVYDCWDPTKHILPRDTTALGLTGDPNDPIPRDWERFRSIDFGFTNPFVCQWWASPKYKYTGPPGAQDRTEIPYYQREWVMYREIYHSGRTVTEHAKVINLLTANEKIHTTVCDWDAGDRADLHNAKIPTIKADKEVSPGIQSTYQCISNDRVFILENSLVESDYALTSTNKPSATQLEFAAYMRPKGKEGKFNPKEDPVKVNDHGMDALRYILHTFKAAFGPSGQVVVGNAQDVEVRASQLTQSNHAPVSRFVSGTRSYSPTRTSWSSYR